MGALSSIVGDALYPHIKSMHIVKYSVIKSSRWHGITGIATAMASYSFTITAD